MAHSGATTRDERGPECVIGSSADLAQRSTNMKNNLI
jgi:hypothetical protein